MKTFAFCRTGIGILAIGLLAAFARAQATLPTTLPADAAKLSQQITDAYGKLKSLTMSGTITADIDIAGQQNNQSQPFTASYMAPGKFRHAIGDEFLLGSTGQKLYTYDIKQKTYAQGDAPARRGPLSEFPSPIPRILDMQNPSLLLAIADNTMADLLENAKDVHVAPQQTVGKVACDLLAFTASDGRVITLFADAQTHLLRQVRYDLAQVFIERGAPEVKAAIVRIDYAETKIDGALDEFAWVIPEGAREQAAGRPMASTSSLEGQPAPNFKLKGLDGKEVQLASLKNQVIVLDFWATWCPACVHELPDLNRLYEQRKARDVRMFAVNVKEDAPEVKAFVVENKLTLPVLLDSDGEVSQAYGMWALPQTVIIGRDGKVRKVFVGIPPGGPAELARAIDAALDSK